MTSHQQLRHEFVARIQSGEWPLGARIPDEITLAAEYGCARATVNRALRGLADDGLVVRKRKGGTRVSAAPARRAHVTIAVLREQVEAQQQTYRHKTLRRRTRVPSVAVRDKLGLDSAQKAVFLETHHFADEQPFALERRWVNPVAVPEIYDAPFDEISANEWLVRTVPFTNASLAFSAKNADADIADGLDIEIGAAVFVMDRTTWLGDKFVTTMTLYYPPGYELTSQL